MGKSSKKIKRQQQLKTNKKVPPQVDPLLLKAFAQRSAEARQEGIIEGMSQVITLFSQWTAELDQHVKGIGEKKKELLTAYYAERMKEMIDAKIQTKNISG